MIDPPLPDRADPGAAGHRPRLPAQLAERHGYVFYVIPGPAPFTNIAYWGPPIRVGLPQRAITVNMGPETNVEARRCRQRRARPRRSCRRARCRTAHQPEGARCRRSPACGRRSPRCRPGWSTGPTCAGRSCAQSGLTAVQALAQAQGTMDASTDAVKARGRARRRRYGGVLQARGLVGVRGAGFSYDGLYYVKRVTHKIALGSTRSGSSSRARARLDHPGGARDDRRPPFYGKYRGKVENNVDPLQQGRVQVSVPAVLGDGRLSWAMPCVPVRRAAGRASSLSRRSGPTSGSSSRPATRTTRSGPAASGARARCPRQPAVPADEGVQDRRASP